MRGGVEIPITVPTGARPGYVTAFETAFCISRSGGGYIAVLVGNRNGAAPHCQPGKEQRCNPHQMAEFRFGLCNGRQGHTPSLRAALRRAFFWKHRSSPAEIDVLDDAGGRAGREPPLRSLLLAVILASRRAHVMLNSRQGKTPPSSSAAGMVLLRRRTGQPSDALEKLFGTIVFRRGCPFWSKVGQA